MTSPLDNSTPKRKPNNPNGRAPIDLTGQRFERLLVLSLHHRTYGQYYWTCRCDCGKETVASTAVLRRGTTRSCGCFKRENTSRLKKTHGHSHCADGKPSRTYRAWQGMMSRCYTPTAKRYEDWGGRGIRVCDRWHEFENFLADMGECPAGLSIDRFPDNDGNYEPGNCRWANAQQQADNKRPYRAKYERTCSICERLFLAVMPRATYCSTECHNEATKRMQREKKARAI